MPKNIDPGQRAQKKDARKGAAFFALVQLAMALLQLLCAVGLAALALLVEMPGWCAGLLWALAALCAALIIPALRVLKIRFQEIEGGELDAARKY